MARKKLTIDKWYGGISNDPSVGSTGSCFDARGVEIRKDSRKVKLSSNYSIETTLNTRTNGYIVGAMIPSSSNNVLASGDGKLSNLSNTATDWYYTDSTYTTFYNLFYYAQSSSVSYGVLVTPTALLRWTYDANRADLGTLDNSVVTNGDMSSATGWTVNANWSISGGVATHTPGSTATLTQTLTVSNATKYIVRVKATCTAGSLVVSLGGTTLGTITTAETGLVQTYARTTASTSEAFTFTPSSDYDGAIDYGEVQKSNVASAVAGTFSSNAVYITTPGDYFYVASGNKLVKVDTVTSSWSVTTPVEIDQGYTIVGMSQVGDQTYIYGSDGTNGRQYLWNGSDAFPARWITWYDKPIVRVLNLNNIDYLVTKTPFRRSLYVVNGYQPQLIFQSGNIQASDNDLVEERLCFEGTYINGIETIGNKLLIPTAGGLFSYGNQSPGFPQSLVQEYTWNGGEPRTTYYSESTSPNIYIFYSSTLKSGSLKHYSRTLYQLEESSSGDDYSKFDPGFIRLHPFLGTNYGQRKSTQSYKIGAKIPSGTYINLYSRCDDETGYANFYTDADEDSISTMPTAGATYTNNGNTYTVTSVTSNSTEAIIHCTYTGSADVKYSGTLTKSAGTGDATIKFFRSNEFKLVKQFSNADRGGQKFVHSESYNKIEWIIELVTTSTTKTPELYSFEYLFDEIELDT